MKTQETGKEISDLAMYKKWQSKGSLKNISDYLFAGQEYGILKRVM